MKLMACQCQYLMCVKVELAAQSWDCAAKYGLLVCIAQF